MKFEGLGFLVFGDVTFRGDCPREDVEMVTFFNRLRHNNPEWARLAVHVRNEGLKTDGQFSAVTKHHAEGLNPGASDILIPARIAFVCELKRRDHMKSTWQAGQVEYLQAAVAAGAFACVALGCDGAWAAFKAWLLACGPVNHDLF